MKKKVCRKDQRSVIELIVPDTTSYPTVVINVHLTTHMFHTDHFTAANKRDFGKERWDHITPEMIKSYLNMHPTTAITTLVDDVYFNPDVPENNTVAMMQGSHITKVTNNQQVHASPIATTCMQMRQRCFDFLFNATTIEKEVIEKVKTILEPDDVDRETAYRINNDYENVCNTYNWILQNLVKSSSNDARKTKKVDALLAAHLEVRTLPNDPMTPLLPRCVAISAKVTVPDEVIPPDALDAQLEWPRALLLYPPRAPLTSSFTESLNTDLSVDHNVVSNRS